MLIPDRLPSLVVLVGFWVPPAMAGLVAAWSLRSSERARTVLTYAVLLIFVLGYAAAWFLFNLGRMPPYIPGSTTDPTFAPHEAVRGLAVVTSALVLPGSALACVLAFRIGRALNRRNA
ncbi:MAG TPA: hypothetical protein VN844_07160 [Pyrinomonadaceae bacterium]|nr:hypothetical protein [Pyrinomonadaceae bacterium]